MVTSQQLRTRAAEFGELIKVADHPDVIGELRRQQRTFTDLANNEDWLAKNLDKIVRRTDKDDSDRLMLPPTARGEGQRRPLSENEEQMLRCLGAAVIMQWSTLPTKLQKELFDNAASMGDLWQGRREGATGPLSAQPQGRGNA